ncbi:MAG: FHA domain-containing protein [Armatimonadetes bacterium]|nr:FHA domain-containing protein [Armatimonadota bacterium]
MPTLTDSMGNEHKLHPGVNVVGRELGCDVALTWEQSVSRRHAELVVDQGTVTVRDLGSTNGTFVGGQRITGATPVASGTEITFGRSVMRLT